MRCDQIMKTRVECIGPRDTVQAAAQTMRDENIGFLPVCDDQKRVIGTITDRDIAIRVTAADRPASLTWTEDVMTHDAVACKPSDDLSRAQQLMSLHHKSRILCLDEKGRLIGVISLSDIARHVGSASAQTLRDISEREAHP
jgi:CBS domain-containing protein